MIPILPSIAKSDAEPVKDQVQGLLSFADALLNAKRRDAGLRARRGGRCRSPPRRQQKSVLPPAPPKEAEREYAGRDQGLHTEDVGSEQFGNSADFGHKWERPPRSLAQPGSRRTSLFLDSTASDADSQAEASPRKKTTAKHIPQLTPSPRASKLDAGVFDDDGSAQFFSLTDTEMVVEKYRLRSRAAEAAVQASLERFHRGRKLQEPLLDDLKHLKKVVTSERKSKSWTAPVRVEARVEVGIRSSWQSSKAKKEKELAEEGVESDASSFSESSSSGASPRQTTINLTPKGAEQTPKSVASSKESSRRGCQDRSPSATRGLSPEEEEEQLYDLAKDLQQKEEAQSIRLQRSEDLRSTLGDSGRDWLQDAHGNRAPPFVVIPEPAATLVMAEPRYRAKRAPRCLQPAVGKEALTPAELRSLPGARGRQLPFWHSNAWSGSLRAPAGRVERALHEVPRQRCVDPQDSPSRSHRFIIAAAKASESTDEAKTLRLEALSSQGSSSTNTEKGVQFDNKDSKDRLAKSCLKPWRSPVEALIGKSFVFPSGRRGSRMSDLMASTHKGSKATELPQVQAETEVDHEATSHTAWEAIKRTHGFMMLCQQRL